VTRTACWRFGRRHQQQRRRAVANGRGVEQADGIGHDAPLVVDALGDGFLEHGVGIFGPVAVGVQGKGGKIGALVAVLVHVPAHNQGIQPDKRDAVNRFRNRHRRRW
jgi:hypothetical protein